MNIKERIDKIIDTIDENRKIIVTVSLSILGFILLFIIFFISSEELSVSSEASTLLKNIEERKYSVAVENYENWEAEFSPSKMKRLNKSIANKINRLLLESADSYLNEQIPKEHYIGIINTINSFEDIQVDLKKIVEQSKRVSEMYEDEVIDYDIAISYINTVASLNGMDNRVDQYKQSINEYKQSRDMYNQGLDNQEKHKYKEAIEFYDKVLEKDNKYYKLSNEQKEKCIELMYDYYKDKAKDANRSGDYEGALTYISYIKPYYQNDQSLIDLEKEYQKNLSLYTLSENDIINLISNKSGESKDSLSVEYFQQMINGKKYYYVEVFVYNSLKDEVLIDAKDKKIYSYKSSNKDYNTKYSDGYFRITGTGAVQFAITRDNANFILEEKLRDNKADFKGVTNIEKEKIYKYVDPSTDVDKILKTESNIYYYQIVNRGWFKKKDVYMTNMYTKEVYNITDEGIKKY